MNSLDRLLRIAARLPDYVEGRGAVIQILQEQIVVARNLYPLRPMFVTAVERVIAQALHNDLRRLAQEDEVRLRVSGAPPSDQAETFGRDQRERLILDLHQFMEASCPTCDSKGQGRTSPPSTRV